MSGRYFFNAAIQLPQGSNLALENTSGNKLFFNSNSSMATSYELVFPPSDGTVGQSLITDGYGNLRFDTVSSETSSIASSNITNTTTGDIIFTTDNGNTTITSNGTGKYLKLNNLNGNGIIIGTKTNAPIDENDTSNISMLIDNSSINYLLDTNIFSNITMFNNSQQPRFNFNNSTSVFNYNSDIESNNTTTGTIVVTGGVGIASNLNVGGNLYIDKTLTVNGFIDFINNAQSDSSTTGALVVIGGVGIASNLNVGGNVSVTEVLNVSGISNFNDTTQSSSTTTGAVIVTGGVGIASNLNVGGNVSVTEVLNVSGISNFNDTTQSSSTTTGALVVTGGVGIASNLNVGGNVSVTDNVVITGNLTVNGTTTTINSTVTTIDDPVIELGLGSAVDSFDRGIKGIYNDGESSKSVFFGWDREVDAFTFIPDATFSSTNNASGTTGKAIFSVIESQSTTESTSTTTGGMLVSGGLGVVKNLNVGGNVTISNKLIVGVDVFGDSTDSATDLWNGSNFSTNKHLLLSTGSSLFSSTSTYTTGQMMNLFFTTTTDATANIDFSLSNLYSGSGTAQYLFFNQTGQSASLLYIDTGVSGTTGWRIINTGAQIF